MHFHPGVYRFGIPRSFLGTRPLLYSHTLVKDTTVLVSASSSPTPSCYSASLCFSNTLFFRRRTGWDGMGRAGQGIGKGVGIQDQQGGPLRYMVQTHAHTHSASNQTKATEIERRYDMEPFNFGTLAE